MFNIKIIKIFYLFKARLRASSSVHLQRKRRARHLFLGVRQTVFPQRPRALAARGQALHEEEAARHSGRHTNGSATRKRRRSVGG